MALAGALSLPAYACTYQGTDGNAIPETEWQLSMPPLYSTEG
jgi:hypothetical protein